MSCIQCLFGCLTLMGCRDRLTQALVYFPPPVSYAVKEDPNTKTPGMTLIRRGKLIKSSTYANQYFHFQHVSTKKGTKIPLIHIKYPDADTTIIFSHGNATDIGHMRNHFNKLAAELKVAIIAYDYSGYGMAEVDKGATCFEKGRGKPFPARTYCDAEAIFDYYELPENKTKKVILYGQSLGSSVTCYLASTRKVDGFVVHSGFLSTLRVIVPMENTRWFDVFPNVDRIKQTSAPCWIIHGQADTDIPIAHGTGLYEHAPVKYPEPWFVPGGRHNNIEVRYQGEYLTRFKAYLKFIENGEVAAMEEKKSSSDTLTQGPGAPVPTPPVLLVKVDKTQQDEKEEDVAVAAEVVHTEQPVKEKETETETDTTARDTLIQIDSESTLSSGNENFKTAAETEEV